VVFWFVLSIFVEGALAEPHLLPLVSIPDPDSPVVRSRAEPGLVVPEDIETPDFVGPL
jgi:hypothetical protein